jgi:CBS domain-containing protein
MSTRTQSLHEVRAREIMQDRVVQLDPSTSIEEATTILSDLNISGAPVVDAGGKLLGMISGNDIARPENIDRGAVTARRSAYEMGDLSGDDDGTPAEDVIEDMEDFSPEALRTGTVADFMSRDLFTVEPETSIG